MGELKWQFVSNLPVVFNLLNVFTKIVSGLFLPSLQNISCWENPQWAKIRTKTKKVMISLIDFSNILKSRGILKTVFHFILIQCVY